MPELTKLDLSIQGIAEYIPPLINTMKELKSLQSLTIPVFRDLSEILPFLSRHERLKELRILSKKNQTTISRFPRFADQAHVYFPALEILDIHASYGAASKFFCRVIPYLSTIQISTAVHEEPDRVRSLLSKMSTFCPFITHVSLDIIRGSAIAQSVSDSQSNMSSDILRPILQRSSISSFRIEYCLPISMGLQDITAIASAWPQLRVLSLCCDPLLQQSTSVKLGLEAILPFIRHCPEMEELGLFIDTSSSAIPSTSEIDALPSPFKKLKCLSVGTSEIQHEGAVAQFLSLICTPGCVVKYGANWFEDDRNQEEMARRWKAVNDLLPHLFAVRVWYERKMALNSHNVCSSCSRFRNE
ncbi:hypothetical protein VKT23_012013 [Stygiomarasmius scandens]|uniref:Uncharacterized protein n=1 Tax=Marasmiellus scandens TaxID=2682957 RepID=A0ABR1JCM8_9AGAR